MGTYSEHIWQGAFALAAALGDLTVSIAAIALPRPAGRCFPDLESRDLKRLRLISFFRQQSGPSAQSRRGGLTCSASLSILRLLKAILSIALVGDPRSPLFWGQKQRNNSGGFAVIRLPRRQQSQGIRGERLSARCFFMTFTARSATRHLPGRFHRLRWLAICLRYAMRASRSVSGSTAGENAGICCCRQVRTDFGSRTNARSPASVR